MKLDRFLARAPAEQLVQIAAAIELVDGKAPTEFRVWRAGENPTDFGVHVFSASSAKSVMAVYEKRGNTLVVDYDHKSIRSDGPADAGKAAGWFVPEVRDGEMWATRVEWTAAARAGIEAKEWRYFSPTYFTRGGEIVRLVNIALTNNPATHNLEPLAANVLAALGGSNNGDRSMKLSSQDMQLAAALVAAVEEVMGKAESPELKKLAQQVDAALDQMMGAPADKPDGSEPEAAPPGDGAADAAAAKTAAKVALAASKRIVAAAARVTGGKPTDADTIVASLERAFEKAKTDGAVALELASEVKKLRADADARETRDLIAANRKKFTPALEKWALSQSPEQLRTWLAAQPEVSSDDAHREPKKKTDDDVTLTAAELQLCSQMKTDPKEMLAHKRKMLGLAPAEVK